MLFLAYLLVPQLVSALAINQRDECNTSTQLRALYMLDTNPAGSTVVAFKINEEDGSLSDQVVTPTGQLGEMGLLIDLVDPNGAPAVAPTDPLYAQDALIVHDDYLFTVNAGSNSVSMFLIDPKNPTAPTLINSAPSLGYFPNSIAYSPALKTACVINGGIVAGVACYSVDHAKGLTTITPLFPLDITQTNPPVGPWNTTSDIQFSPDSTYLLVTVKGTTFAPATSGFGHNYVFPVVNGKVSSAPIVSSIPGMHLNFGFTFLSNSKVLITDFPDYAMATVDPTTFEVTADKLVTVPGAIGLCWSALSTRFNTIFLSDGFQPNITMVDPTTGDMKGTLVLDAAGETGLDLVVDRKYLYVLRGNNNISVTDLTGLNSKGTTDITFKAEFQNFEVVGNRTGFTGLAVYPSS